MLKSNAYFILFIATVSVQDTIIIAILILSTIASLATLRKSRHLMSAKVRYMHSQINRLMFAEVTLECILATTGVLSMHKK